MSSTSGNGKTDLRSRTENRRKAGRHSLDLPATLSVENAPPGVAASPDMLIKIVQMSVGGVGLLADRALDLGTVYRVAAFDSLVPAGMRVRVVSVRPAEVPATYVIGAEIV